MQGSTSSIVASTGGAVTAVCTSCDRYDLLLETLQSFLAMNCHPLDQLIVIEDGPPVPGVIQERIDHPSILWLHTGDRVGQIAAIDLAYSHVRTPYIFHFEDDWMFRRSDFIERSKVILEGEPRCLQVQLRAISDTQGHPVEPEEFSLHGVSWRRLKTVYDYDGVLWHGFSFNPGLRRMVDYVGIEGYGRHASFDFRTPWSAENGLSSLYYKLGYFTAILSDERGTGYVSHLGRGRRVSPPAVQAP